MYSIVNIGCNVDLVSQASEPFRAAPYFLDRVTDIAVLGPPAKDRDSRWAEFTGATEAAPLAGKLSRDDVPVRILMRPHDDFDRELEEFAVKAITARDRRCQCHKGCVHE
jgi:hypothetical protein